ncbi:MAG: hypothetical protein GY700_01680 [Propionibacteriaceae bacterium]|nr:hypothetical protein [Propionibacteriaceae bacterium]
MKKLTEDQLQQAAFLFLRWVSDDCDLDHTRRISKNLLSDIQFGFEKILDETSVTVDARCIDSVCSNTVPISSMDGQILDEVEELAFSLSETFYDHVCSWHELSDDIKNKWRDVARKAIEKKNLAVNNLIDKRIYESLTRDAEDCTPIQYRIDANETHNPFLSIEESDVFTSVDGGLCLEFRDTEEM